MKNISITILMFFLFVGSGITNLFASENIAEFCFQPAKDASLDLKIKHNVDIELPLSKIAKYTICEDKWHPQVDLDVNYEIDFPKEWNCNTLVPLWYIKTCEELQDYFENKKTIKLSEKVSHNCEIGEELINGSELKGRFILEIRKNPMRSSGEKHSYKFTKTLNIKIIGRCFDKTLDSKF